MISGSGLSRGSNTRSGGSSIASSGSICDSGSGSGGSSMRSSSMLNGSITVRY